MRLPLLRLSKKANAFSAKGVSLRSAPRSSAHGGRFDARSAQSVFPPYTPPEKRFHFLPSPASDGTLRGFFDTLRGRRRPPLFPRPKAEK